MVHVPPPWRPPSSSAALQRYFVGTWLLAKEFSYERGGVSGTFSGRASFSPLEGDEWLAYEENGLATLGVDTFDASRRLLYDCTPGSPVACYFDECTTQRTPERVRAAARPFHDIHLKDGEAPALSEHPCGPDMYRGKLIFVAPDAFRFDWIVTGPRKQGWISNRFSRADGAGAGG